MLYAFDLCHIGECKFEKHEYIIGSRGFHRWRYTLICGDGINIVMCCKGMKSLRLVIMEMLGFG